MKAEIGRYFAALARRRADEPGEDLLSALVAARDTGGLSTPELISLAVILQLNGMDMVRKVSSTMVYVLLTHPDQLARIRATPALLPPAIDEMLRFVPHRNGVGLPRIATEDVRVGEVTIKAGEAVYVSYLTANRDPEIFADPNRLDVGRVDNPHMAFGHGIHYCVGAALTRMELDVVLSRLLARFPQLSLACPPTAVQWHRGGVSRGPVSLPVSWAES